MDNKNEEEKLKSKGIIYFFVMLFVKSFWIPEFTEINKKLTKCFMISKDSQYSLRRKKNRLIQAPLTVIPVIITVLTLKFFLLDSEVITKSIKVNLEVVKRAIESKEKNFYKNIKFNDESINYSKSFLIILLTNHSLFYLIGRLIVRANPLIKESEEMKELFIKKGWSLPDGKVFLKTRSGLLCELGNVSPDTIIKDKEFWREYGASPKPDYLEYEFNNRIILFEFGITLQKIEYKLP